MSRNDGSLPLCFRSYKFYDSCIVWGESTSIFLQLHGMGVGCGVENASGMHNEIGIFKSTKDTTSSLKAFLLLMTVQ